MREQTNILTEDAALLAVYGQLPSQSNLNLEGHEFAPERSTPVGNFVLQRGEDLRMTQEQSFHGSHASHSSHHSHSSHCSGR